MDKIRVAICEDMKQVREYFSATISAQEDMEVVGEAENGINIMEFAERVKPEIILMDIQMETERAGINATAMLKQKLPEIKIIISTIHDSDELIFEAFEAGAVDYILKSENEEDLLSAIRNAHANNRLAVHKVIDEFCKMKREKQSLMHMVTMMCNLSPTELETLVMLCGGMKRSEIAERRCIELITVHTMVGRIMKKLGYKNSHDMIEDVKALGVLDLIKNTIQNKK